jgi:L-lactate dehydrogenase complex protein LldE
VRHYPQLFADDPAWHKRALRAASITWEITEYLVDGLGVADLGAKLPPTRAAFHDACHGLRGLGLKTQARELVNHIEGVTIQEMNGSDQCCGFGGLFSVKMAPISGAMLGEKIKAIDSVEVDVVLTGDCSCMTHINGGLSRQGKSVRVQHVMDLLAQGLNRPNRRRLTVWSGRDGDELPDEIPSASTTDLKVGVVRLAHGAQQAVMRDCCVASRLT